MAQKRVASLRLDLGELADDIAAMTADEMRRFAARCAAAPEDLFEAFDIPAKPDEIAVGIRIRKEGISPLH
jgi:hypothetical protein